MATKCASRESCKSVSINVAPSATALRNAASVFSGACPEAPRCPITSIPIALLSLLRLFRATPLSRKSFYFKHHVSIHFFLPFVHLFGLHPESNSSRDLRNFEGVRRGGSYEEGNSSPVYSAAADRIRHNVNQRGRIAAGWQAPEE